MRSRVLSILTAFIVLLVALLSWSTIEAESRAITQAIEINRGTALNRFAQLAFESSDDGDTRQLEEEMDRYSELYGEGVLVRLQQGTISSGGLQADREDVRYALGSAQLNLSDTTLTPVRIFGPEVEVITRSFGTTNQVLGEVVLEVSLVRAQEALRVRSFVVLLVSALISATLLMGASRVTRWVLRPVHRLTMAADELATTGKINRLPDDGPPELQILTRSFNTMARAVSDSNDAQRQLIADTSHELRNPIGALRLRMDLLQLELKGDEERQATERVITELERVENVLNGVLQLASAEHRAGQWEIGAHSGPQLQAENLIHPHAIVQEAVQGAEPAAEHQRCVLRTMIAPAGETLISCNGAELFQMLQELMNNAIKYAPGGTITASTRTGPDGFVIEISDNGAGLTDTEKSAALSRFWRSPAHRLVHGTGLGLPIVTKLAAANGGQLVLADNTPRGLIARLEFPTRFESGGEGR